MVCRLYLNKAVEKITGIIWYTISLALWESETFKTPESSF